MLRNYPIIHPMRVKIDPKGKEIIACPKVKVVFVYPSFAILIDSSHRSSPIGDIFLIFSFVQSCISLWIRCCWRDSIWSCLRTNQAGSISKQGITIFFRLRSSPHATIDIVQSLKLSYPLTSWLIVVIQKKILLGDTIGSIYKIIPHVFIRSIGISPIIRVEIIRLLIVKSKSHISPSFIT